MIIEISTDFANLRIVSKDREVNREWLIRHGLHVSIKQYRKEFGAIDTDRLLDELTAYHKLKVVGVE